VIVLIIIVFERNTNFKLSNLIIKEGLKMSKIIDTHTHIYDEQFQEDFDDVMKNIEEQMEGIVSIGFDMESSLKSIELANKYDFIHAVIGIHPVDIKKYNAEVDKELEKLALSEKKVVAIGEIGLDYHWMEDPEEVQKEGFRRQIELAERVKLPIVIHTREALQDTLDILKEYPNVGGILHCYPGSFQAAKPFLDRYYIGVGGTVTFKNNRKTKELVKELPLDRIVLETDCPYLTPVPFRGKRNQPVYTKYVAEEIAAIKGFSVEEAINRTSSFKRKVYTEKEIEYIEKKKEPYASYAGRFAAKEAVSKALGTGVRGFSLNDVEILNDELGKPTVTLYNNLLNHAEDLKIQISISHSREYAVSTVIIYKE